VCAHYGGGSSGAKEGEGDVAMIRLQRLIDPAAYDIQRRAHTRHYASLRLHLLKDCFSERNGPMLYEEHRQ
jgi:hypothetical protein